MDRQDIGRISARVRELMQDKKYRKVIELVENIDAKQMTRISLVLDVVEAYERIGRKTEAKTVLLNFYKRRGISGCNMMRKLIELCIETGDISNANELCTAYENNWPESSISDLMKYQICSYANGTLEEQIYYLERYNKNEFEERWAYELARLYERNGQTEKCAAACHEIICLFGHGKYVEKAVQLKERVSGLSEDEIGVLREAQRKEDEKSRMREEAERKMREEAQQRALEEHLRQQEELRRQQEEQERAEAEEALRMQQEMEAADKEEMEEEEESTATEEAVKPRVYWTGSEPRIIYEEDENAMLRQKEKDAEEDKIRQTELQARLLKEKKEAERMAREEKIIQALNRQDRYTELETQKSQSIYLVDMEKDAEEAKLDQKQKTESQNKISPFEKMASGFKKNRQSGKNKTDDDVEYIVVGRNSQAYIQDIESRMMEALDMLEDEEIETLTTGQIKEIYELKVLKDVREYIKDMIVEDDNGKAISNTELDHFVNTEPFYNPLHDLRPVEENEEESKTVQEEPVIIQKTVQKKEPDMVQETAQQETASVKQETAQQETASVKQKTAQQETASVKQEAAQQKTASTEQKTETVFISDTEQEEAADFMESVQQDKNVTTRKSESVQSIVDAEDDVVMEAEYVEDTDASDGWGADEWEEPEILDDWEEEPEKTAEEEAIKKVKIEIAKEVKIELQPDANERSAETETRTQSENAAEETFGEKAKQQSDSEEEKEREESAPNTNHTAEPVPEKKETILDRITDADRVLTEQEFKECAAAYAQTKGFQIEEMAFMTIAVLMEEMKQQEDALTLTNARILVDDAIQKSQKKNPFDKFAERYDKKRAYILRDRHFYWKGKKNR